MNLLNDNLRFFSIGSLLKHFIFYKNILKTDKQNGRFSICFETAQA